MGVRCKRVLITGSGGFTGRHLRRTLESGGYEVIGVTNDRNAQPDERIADLTNAAAIRDVVFDAAPDYVVHLAAISYVGHGDPRAFYETNVIGTVNLLEPLAALALRPRRVVVASSANVYGNSPGEALEESAPTVPVNHYAASKLAMEAVVAGYRAKLPCVIARPFNITGPGQTTTFLVPKIVDHFARRVERLELGNLDVERDFLDVRTVVAIYRLLLECEIADGSIVNVCSGRGIALRWIIGELERLTGHRLEIAVNPALVRTNEIHRLVGCNARLRALVGAWPDIDFSQTLHDMIAAAEQKMVH